MLLLLPPPPSSSSAGHWSPLIPHAAQPAASVQADVRILPQTLSWCTPRVARFRPAARRPFGRVCDRTARGCVTGAEPALTGEWSSAEVGSFSTTLTSRGAAEEKKNDAAPLIEARRRLNFSEEEEGGGLRVPRALLLHAQPNKVSRVFPQNS